MIGGWAGSLVRYWSGCGRWNGLAPPSEPGMDSGLRRNDGVGDLGAGLVIP